MDIRCPVCCEPWEIDTLHEYVTEMREMFPREIHTFRGVYQTFIAKGCGQAFNGWKVSCEPDLAGARVGLSHMAELFGDDVDGFASFCEDMEALGGLS